jgi:small subunit ribosomal protein S13
MARIAGVDLPKHKRIEVGITYIYGVGKFIAKEILQKTNISPDLRVKDLTEKEIAGLQQAVDKYIVEGDLRRKAHSDIGRLKAINCYRGIRHKLRLPVRGQRTRANARTWKGPRPAKAGKKK